MRGLFILVLLVAAVYSAPQRPSCNYHSDCGGGDLACLSDNKCYHCPAGQVPKPYYHACQRKSCNYHANCGGGDVACWSDYKCHPCPLGQEPKPYSRGQCQRKSCSIHPDCGGHDVACGNDYKCYPCPANTEPKPYHLGQCQPKGTSCSQIYRLAQQTVGSYNVEINFPQAVRGGWWLRITFDDSHTTGISNRDNSAQKAGNTAPNSWWVGNARWNKNMKKGAQLKLQIYHNKGYTRNNIIGIILVDSKGVNTEFCNTV